MKENILDKVKRIFKRTLAIFGASLTLVLPSSDAAKDRDTGNIGENNSKAEFTEKLKEGINTTEEELEKVINGYEKNEKNEKSEDNNNNGKETSKQGEDSLVYKENTTTSINNGNSKEQNISSYNKLLTKFNNEFNKKNFPKESYKYLKEVFDSVYKNYDDWNQTNKDLPDKETYITENIIDNIKNINNIFLYSQNSNEGKKQLKEHSAFGYTDKDFNITIIYDELDSEKNIERFAHELAHIGQKNIVFNSEYFKGYEYLKDIIIEGGATSRMKYTKENKTEKLGADIIKLEDYTLEYKSDNGEGYPREMNLYNNIMFLTGYDIMNEINSGKPIDSIKKSIESRYGKEKSNKIFTELKNLNSAYKNKDNKGKMQSAVNLQKEFLKCIEKDIENLKTKEDVIKYTNIYREYKINNLPRVCCADKDFTNQYFDIEKLDNKMLNKIVETRAFQFSNNKKENEDAIKCLLFTTDSSFYQKDGIYEGIYVPSNLNSVKYMYQNGKLILNYDNKTEYDSANRNVYIEMEITDGKVRAKEIEYNKGYTNLRPIISETEENVR